MNEQHLRLCSSAEWGEGIKNHLVPWLATQPDQGDDVLEVGPGPGLTTDQLRLRVPKLTAVESDASLAAQLEVRLGDTNVAVVHADASALPYPDGHFSGATSFFMLHHVPSAELQDRILSELARVLRPGGVLLAVDSLDSPAFRELHMDDICVPIDPVTIVERLERAGFDDIALTVEQNVRWSARTPLGDAA